jgi:hypothetical protein
MSPHRSNVAGKLKTHWTILPPLKLKGVSTSLVESVPSYLARMLWTTGVSLNHLAKFVARRAGPGAGSTRTFMTADALHSIAISRIRELEVLTGERHLRCGSLWALSEIMSSNANVYGKNRRRWCPRCYGDWNNDSYEPLVWRIDLLGVCPRHQCRMECTCPTCGSFQRDVYLQEHRLVCCACGASLAEGAISTKRPAFAQWIDEQILQLIEYCATPRSKPAPRSIYTDFAIGMHVTAELGDRKSSVMRGILKDIDRHARRKRRPNLRSLLNIVCLARYICARVPLCSEAGVRSDALRPVAWYELLASAIRCSCARNSCCVSVSGGLSCARSSLSPAHEHPPSLLSHPASRAKRCCSQHF